MTLPFYCGQNIHGLDCSVTEPKRQGRQSAIIRRMTQARLLFPPLTASMMAAFLWLAMSANGYAEVNKLLLSATTLRFDVRDASARPPAQTVLISSSDAPLTYTTAIGYVSTAAGWLSVASESGVTPSTIAVNVDAHSLASGMYMGFVRIS